MSVDRSLLPVMREIGDLKRITSAGRRGSIASRAFATAWARLLCGEPSVEVALDVTAACLVATRLGDLDGENLPALGLPRSDLATIQRAALAEVLADVAAPQLLYTLQGRCEVLPSLSDAFGVPDFVAALMDQPRAGATCPGRARIILGPPENHAEHCIAVAVYAVLLSEPGTNIAVVFLAALAHHFHNVAMSDAGYAGEILLGAHLDTVIASATRAVLDAMPAPLSAEVEAARAVLADAETPEGRAFHAADVIDRVLEIEQHIARSRVSMDDILDGMALVHDGPIKPFHDGVLARMGLV